MRTLTQEQKDKQAKSAREWYWNNKERACEAQKARREANPEHARALAKKSRDKLLDDIYKAYGDKCSCCGESNRFFLSVDHVNGGGTKHRKSVGGSSHPVYRDIRKRGYPDEYRILCFNCNLGRERNNGICPHQPSGMEIIGDKDGFMLVCF